MFYISFDLGTNSCMFKVYEPVNNKFQVLFYGKPHFIFNNL